MINDVLTSGKGPGVIGTLLAVLVLGGFSGLGLMVLNSDSSSEISIDQQVKIQKEDLISLEESIVEQKEHLNMYRVLREKTSQLSRLQAREKTASKELVLEQESIGRAQAEIQSAYESWDRYKNEYRQNERALWKGKTVDLSEQKGEAYKKAVIFKIDPLSIRVSLSSGPKTVPYAELPNEMQDRLQFDAGEAAEFNKALAEVALEQKAMLKKFNANQADKKAEAKVRQRIEYKSKIKRLIQQREAELDQKINEASRHGKAAAEARKEVARAAQNGRQSMAKAKVTAAEERRANANRVAQNIRDKITLLRRELASMK